jgi:hypothetical protein
MSAPFLAGPLDGSLAVQLDELFALSFRLQARGLMDSPLHEAAQHELRVLGLRFVGGDEEAFGVLCEWFGELSSGVEGVTCWEVLAFLHEERYLDLGLQVRRQVVAAGFDLSRSALPGERLSSGRVWTGA